MNTHRAQFGFLSSGPAARRGTLASVRRTAFTLIEMLVALVILVIMMGAIGEVFHLAGHSVRVGQATLGTMAQVRVIEHQMAADIHEMDTTGYLVVRQRQYAPTWNPASVQYQPGDEVAYGSTYYVCTAPNTSNVSNTPATLATDHIDWNQLTGAVGTIPIWRADQLAFMANGNFHSRSGDTHGDINNALSANTAMIWYGQMAVSYGNTYPVTPTYPGWPAYFAQSTVLATGTPPTGLTAGQLTLGRMVTLLVPNGGTGTAYSGYPANLVTTNFPGPTASGNISYGSGSATAYLTSCRLDAAAYSAAQAGAYAASQTGVTNLANVANDFCFRYATVNSPGASSVAGPVAGAFRMQPVLMQGVCSLAIDVGLPVATPPGTIDWYGISGASLNPTLYPLNADIGSTTGHLDTAAFVFTPASKPDWPVALRITYMVTDPADQLSGPLTITQIVHLPQ